MTGKVYKKLRGYSPERSRRAFTLIELIVVVAIIGILASLVTLNLLDNAAKARDTKRIADVTQIWKAIELYKANNMEALPINLTDDPGYVYVERACVKTRGYDPYVFKSCADSGLTKGFQNNISVYMSPLPEDPINDSTNNYYGYAYSVANNWYTVFAKLENDNNKNLADHCYGFTKGTVDSNITNLCN